MTLREINLTDGGRKIAILGDMMELGSHSVAAHTKLGELVVSIADMLVVVGIRAQGIAEAARNSGFSADKIQEFSDWKGAARVLPGEIKKGDVVLIKGSQSVRLEKVTAALLAPEVAAPEVLVRQDEEWQKR